MTCLQMEQVGAVLTSSSRSWFIFFFSSTDPLSQGAFQSAVNGSARFFYTRPENGSQSLTIGVQFPHGRVGGGYPYPPLTSLPLT